MVRVLESKLGTFVAVFVINVVETSSVRQFNWSLVNLLEISSINLALLKFGVDFFLIDSRFL